MTIYIVGITLLIYSPKKSYIFPFLSPFLEFLLNRPLFWLLSAKLRKKQEILKTRGTLLAIMRPEGRFNNLPAIQKFCKYTSPKTVRSRATITTPTGNKAIH